MNRRVFRSRSKHHQTNLLRLRSAALHMVTDGVIIADASDIMIDCNPKAEHLLNIPKNQLLNQPLASLTDVFDSDQIEWLERLRHLTTDDIVASPDLRQRSTQLFLNGLLVRMQTIVQFRDKAFLGTVTQLCDITESDASTLFFESILSEYRTPLNKIKGYSDLLAMGAADELTPLQLEFVNIIQEEVGIFMSFTDDILLLHKLEVGHALLIQESLNVYEVLERLQQYESYRPTETFKIHLAENIPLIQADPQYFAHLLVSLIDYGKLYWYQREHRLDIAPDGETAILIRLDGLPYKKDFADRIGENARILVDVLSLNVPLSLVKRLVRFHHGQIWIERDDEQNASLCIRLLTQPTEHSSA